MRKMPLLIVLLFAASVFAQTNSTSNTANGWQSTSASITLTRVADGEADISEYWAQFGENRLEHFEVEDWLAVKDVVLLWNGDLGTAFIEIYWDRGTETVTVIKDGETLSDVVMVQESGKRPAWVAMFEDGQAQLSGFIDLDVDSDDGGVGVLGLTIGNSNYRMFTQVSLSEFSSEFAMAAGGTSSCVCFGLGKSTRSCSKDDCDTGVSCGKTRSCRWKAGTVFAVAQSDQSSLPAG